MTGLPRQLFLTTLSDFYFKLRDKSFWQSQKAQEIAIEALGQDYMKVEHGEHLRADATSLEAALDEFNRRKIHMEVK